MPKAIFPQKQKNWVVSNTRTYFGDIGETYNVDLDYVLGAVVQGNSLLPYTTNQDISGMQMATDFAYSNFSDGNYYYWAACEKIYKANWTGQSFAADTLTNSPTNLNDADIEITGKTTGTYGVRDIVVVSGVSNGSDLARFSADFSATAWKTNWWTDSVANGGLAQTPLKVNIPHVLLTFGNSPILFISDGNMIHRVNTPHSPTNNDVMYGAIILPEKYTITWMQKTREKIYIGARGVYAGDPGAMFEYDPYSEQIRQINIDEGGTVGFVWNNILYVFDVKGQLRYWNGSSLVLTSSLPTSFREHDYLTLPHRNGIAISEKSVYFLISGSPPRINAGIWVFSSSAGNFYHLASPQPSRTTQRGFGETFIQSYGGGAVYAVDIPGALLIGINGVSAVSGSGVNGIFSYWVQNNPSFSPERRSYFITPKILSSDINNIWRNIAIKYNPRIFPSGRIQNSQIIVKYQTSDMINYNEFAIATWVNSTTFTTPYYGVGDSISVGDEIFITSGDNSGLMAHVVSITGTDPKTIVLDEGYLSNPTGQSYFIWGNWKKVPDTITDNTQQSKIIDIGETSEWIRFKIEIRGTTYPGFGVEEIQVGYQPNLTVER